MYQFAKIPYAAKLYTNFSIQLNVAMLDLTEIVNYNIS